MTTRDQLEREILGCKDDLRKLTILVRAEPLQRRLSGLLKLTAVMSEELDQKLIKGLLARIDAALDDAAEDLN